ncbi:MAG: hypothetical protein GY765_18525, partial [bacterium]|nr:hypothetical protein [bacterium]
KEAKIDIISKFIPHLVPAAGIADSIYVYARSDGGKDSSVTRYDTNLEIKKKYIIRYGKGPGEAINPQFLPDISGSILVYAPVNGRYIRFSPDLEIIGEHRRRYFEGSFVAGGAYMPACNSVLDGYSLHHDFFKGRDVVSIFRLKANGRVSEKIIYKAPRLFYSKAKEFLVGKWFHFGYFFGNIYVLDKSGYKILKMDDNGNILKA